MKYRCKICGYIYDEEKEGKTWQELGDEYTCPMCFTGKVMFEPFREELSEKEKKSKRIFEHAVLFDENNLGVEKDDAVCIDCGICKATCLERCGLNFGEDTEKCLTCGQCIMTCPTGALKPRNEVERVLDAKKKGKILVAYTSPAIRVSIGEAFGYEPGTFLQDELVSSLRLLGFTYVFDTTFGADLTIMEEAAELKNRLLNGGVLPMFTSCCPAWVKYAETFYPEILDHLSTCKSPIGMEGIMVKEYFAKQMNLDKETLYTVAITPCTAKKFELKREEIPGTDAVITVSELTKWLKDEQIDLRNVSKSSFDSLLGEGSGGGMIFGNTSGVCESALRTLYYYMTGENYDEQKISFSDVRGYENFKEATFKINDLEVKVAVVHKISAAKKLLEDVKNGTSPYHFIEIMNCQGGCIGGGGQPKYNEEMEHIVKEKRIAGLYKKDKEDTIHASYENKDIQKIYRDFLIEPNSEIAHRYLHTTYQKRN